ncbi:hypothetical protein WUBG_18049 [Wuchereria bancrofti]|uniref:Uncharacterized protein n=1 Tax=Wuchereria bancrofti TaxID=6293 RepID=J9E6V1_WUCBA|nr:hypothetical protein WUBG_18049 [Wuchereria bancrofti]
MHCWSVNCSSHNSLHYVIQRNSRRNSAFPNQGGVSSNPGQPTGPTGAGNDDDDLYS